MRGGIWEKGVHRPSARNKRTSIALITVLLALLLLAHLLRISVRPGGRDRTRRRQDDRYFAFVNGTNEPYVDVEVTKAVVNEFLTDGRLKVSVRRAADLVLKGG